MDSDALHRVAMLQHASSFANPWIIKAARARQQDRYASVDALRRVLQQAVQQFALLRGEKPLAIAGTLYEHHLPPEDGGPYPHKPGIPHAAMVYALCEAMRAAEFCSDAPLTEHEEEAHYAHMRDALRLAGFHCPDTRGQAEEFSRAMDTLASGDAQVAAALRLLVSLKDGAKTTPGIEDYRLFLRPVSHRVFERAIRQNA
jgi:hypothetical protein